MNSFSTLGSKKQSLRNNFGLMVFSILFALLISEALLRIFTPEKAKLPEKPKEDWALVPERIWTEHHPSLGWYHQKNKTAFLPLPNGQKAEIHTNSIGLRGTREYTLQKPDGIRRIAVLGDSFAFGWGVQDHESFSARIEAQDPSLEVLNFGVPGYGVDQILVAFRTLARGYHPENVLITLFAEDFWRATRAFADTGHAKPYFRLDSSGKLQLQNVPVPPPLTLRTNQFPDLIEYSPIEKMLVKTRTYKLLRRGMLRLGKNLRLLDADSEEEWLLGRVILKQLIEEVQKSGAQVFIVLLPPDRWIRSDSKEALYKSLLGFAKKEGVPLLDLTPEFRQAAEHSSLTDYYIEGDWHWTAKGHALAADAIVHFLSRHGVDLKTSS